MRRSPVSTTLILPTGTSSIFATSTSVAILGLALEVGRERLLQRLRQPLIAGLVEHVLEKSLDDQARSGFAVHAAAGEIEQLVRVDRPDGGAMRATHVVGFDLKFGFGVGARAFGEQQVAIRLVGVAALRALFDDDDAGVDRVCVTVERAFEKQIAARVGGAVALQRVVVELLLSTREDQAEHIALGAASEQLDFDVALGERTARAEIQRNQF